MNIESLIKSLKDVKYTSDNGHDFPVISSWNFGLIEREVMLWASKQDDEIERKRITTELGRLEAKCIAYEAIIKNSNFAPVIEAVSQKELKEDHFTDVDKMGKE